MTDRRLTPAQGSPGAPLRVSVPVADLCTTPDGARDSQVLWGEVFTPYHRNADAVYGQTACGYFGWVTANALGPDHPTNARVSARGTFHYTAPDLKSPVLNRLPFGAMLQTGSVQGAFTQADSGYIYTPHLAPFQDWVAAAESLLGAPYLWGGRSDLGLDCSGLVQLALESVGIPSPRDSDMQQTLGAPCAQPLQRGDLIFWRGHVGIMRDSTQLLHANAYSMTVLSEPLATASTRIAMTGGPVIAQRRLA